MINPLPQKGAPRDCDDRELTGGPGCCEGRFDFGGRSSGPKGCGGGCRRAAARPGPPQSVERGWRMPRVPVWLSSEIHARRALEVDLWLVLCRGIFTRKVGEVSWSAARFHRQLPPRLSGSWTQRFKSSTVARWPTATDARPQDRIGTFKYLVALGLRPEGQKDDYRESRERRRLSAKHGRLGHMRFSSL